MDIQTVNGSFADADVHALAVPVFKDERAEEGLLQELDAASGGLVRSVIEAEELKGKEGETAYLHLPASGGGLKARRLLLVGAGDRDEFKAAQISQFAGTAVRTLRARSVKTVGLVLRAEGGGDAERLASAAVEGAVIGLFEPDKYRTVDKEERTIERLAVVSSGADEGALKRGAERGRIVGESVNFTRDLANEPGAYMTPTIMAERAQAIANEFGLEIDVLDRDRAEQEGMGAFLSVARGSDEPPKMMVLKYTPEGKNGPAEGEEYLALVGKGITFDTGGISIKPGENMELMKYDMTGGATVLGVMRAVAQLKPPIPILGVVPATENMPSGKATKPGDVVRAMSGKTIEIINTDAEGRLILADAVSYAKKLGATKVIDMATLTGAVSIALGDVNTGLLGTDQELINEIIESGREVGEKFWQLPLDKEYTKQIKSDIADIKNVGGRKAGTITAAAFIKEFADGLSWAHLDIAGTAWGDEAKPFRSKGPTGVAVRTLLNFIERAVRAASASGDGAAPPAGGK
ncbi:MAG TPA: leucyl aminopeptidase [Pyrinomonadaceae bacterium]|jgi:leucyl aminopeptidase|nr:leucyl aminopeptidase [Pyrinomonadaceae bacterium]